MKKEKIDDNQLTFFDVIDGGKHEEDKKNIMKFKKKQLIDVQYAPYEEMFSGFNKIQAITFSYDLSFINNIMKYFDTAEIILGAKFIFDKDEMLPRLLADAAALKNDITKDKRLSNMLKNGDLIIKVSTSIVDHRKLYILSADDGEQESFLLLLTCHGAHGMAVILKIMSTMMERLDMRTPSMTLKLHGHWQKKYLMHVFQLKSLKMPMRIL